MDHPEFLGPTIAEIAIAKAGILKRNVPAFVGQQPDAALHVIEGRAQKLQAPLHLAGQDFLVREEHGRLVFEDERGLLDLPLPRLVGRHQHHNAALAIAAARLIEPGLAGSAFETGMTSAEWPARLQRLTRGPIVARAPAQAEIWLDGGHNEDCGRVLAQAMADFEDKVQRPLVLICGTLATKDTAAILRSFKGLAREVLAVPVAGEHFARTPGDIAQMANAEGIAATACEGIEQALHLLAARDWPVAPRILIAGSLYLAGEILRLNRTPPN